MNEMKNQIFFLRIFFLNLQQNFLFQLSMCEAKFLTSEIYDFTPCAHAQSDIRYIKYAEKTHD